MALSNASQVALLYLNAHAGLRWHQALSAEDARTYKPRPGMLTAYVARPVGDPPTSSDRMDVHADNLVGLADQLDHA